MVAGARLTMMKREEGGGGANYSKLPQNSKTSCMGNSSNVLAAIKSITIFGVRNAQQIVLNHVN